MPKISSKNCYVYDHLVDEDGRLIVNECTKKFVLRGLYLHMDDKSFDVEDVYVRPKVAVEMGINHGSLYSAVRFGNTRLVKYENGSYMFNISVYKAMQSMHGELDERLQRVRDTLYDEGISFMKYARFISERTGVSAQGLSSWWSDHGHKSSKRKLNTRVSIHRVLVACMIDEFLEHIAHSPSEGGCRSAMRVDEEAARRVVASAHTDCTKNAAMRKTG